MAGSGLPRCLFPGCPFRFASGPDRWCADHGQDHGGVYDISKAWLTIPTRRDGVLVQPQRVTIDHDLEPGQHCGLDS
jgi:hypothetical protein